MSGSERVSGGRGEGGWVRGRRGRVKDKGESCDEDGDER